MGATDGCPDHIPLAQSELIDLLVADGSLPAEEEAAFRDLCEEVTVACHLGYHRRLRELKRAYDPFDPDTDTSVLTVPQQDRQRRLNDLYREFAWLLERAHFRHLGRGDLEPILASASAFGVRMDVDFSVFEHLAIFARGDAVQQRPLRRRWGRGEETVEVPVYRRLALILKLRPHPRLQGAVDTVNVYLKVFKDIPKLDVMMLLPGARVRLSPVDRGKIGLPLLGGVAVAVYRVVDHLLDWVQTALASPNVMWGLAIGGIGYGYRSFYGYQQTKQRYQLALTQSLYFQNLDSNSGVLTRLLDEAEEQDSRLAILVYYCLWRHGGASGLSGADLDTAVEVFLDRSAEVVFSCEAGSALAALRRLHLVEESEGRARALPPPRALAALRAAALERIPEEGRRRE
jgi:hypothetical protein